MPNFRPSEFEKSDDFQKEIKKIARYEKQKDRKQVSLNKEKFIADRADMNTEKEEEKEFDELNETKRPVVKKDYYIDEVLAMTTDYLRLSKNKIAQAN